MMCPMWAVFSLVSEGVGGRAGSGGGSEPPGLAADDRVTDLIRTYF